MYKTYIKPEKLIQLMSNSQKGHFYLFTPPAAGLQVSPMFGITCM